MGLIGGALGGLIGGLFGGGGPDPELKQSRLSIADDARTSGLQDRANRSEDEYAADASQGVEQGAQMLGNQHQRSDVSLGGAHPSDMGEVLNRRASRSFQGDLDRIQGSGRAAAGNLRDKRQLQSQSVQDQKTSMYQQIAQRQREAEAQQESARNSVISSVMKGVGGYVGAGVSSLVAKKPVESLTTNSSG